MTQVLDCRNGKVTTNEAVDQSPAMRIHPLHIWLASAAILLSAVLAHRLIPTKLMAPTSQTLDLERLVARQFGEWSFVPGLKLVDAAEPDSLARKLYSMELARGYKDASGHLVMLLVAYGPSQLDQLQLHRPEICYPAAGFRVEHVFRTQLSYRDDAPALKITRLTAYRGERVEPVSYWMRVGGVVASGIVDRQIIKLKYGLRGMIPDGVLVRVSTVGVAEDTAFRVQNKFIRDLLGALDSEGLKFFVGNPLSKDST